MNDTTTRHPPGGGPSSYWHRLLHRWLIEYNPLYLLSATLVLGGMILTSRGLAREGSVYGEVGVAAIAELYAATLIGGAALLTRVGHRRPAVMLALLTVLYQGDLTLHTETCAYLGTVGVWATAGWLALFVGKLYALAWAMKLRLSRVALATASLGAFGLAVLPYHLHEMEARGASALVALWLFALLSLHRTGGVTSTASLDSWGETVLRRSVRAAWLLLGALLSLHVMFWASRDVVSLAGLAPLAPLLHVRRARNEARAWSVVLATLVVVAVAIPGSFAVTAFLAAAALGMRALPGLRASDPARSLPLAAPVQPYRAVLADLPAEASPPSPVLAPPIEHAERMRLMAGALFALYLSAWTLGWWSGPWPAHVLALDLALTAAVLLVVWRAHVRVALAPLGAAWLHLVVQTHVIPPPRTIVEWGGAAMGLGFSLLIASLAASYRLRQRPS